MENEHIVRFTLNFQNPEWLSYFVPATRQFRCKRMAEDKILEPAESKILEALMKGPGRPLAPSDICKSIGEEISAGTIQTAVSRINTLIDNRRNGSRPISIENSGDPANVRWTLNCQVYPDKVPYEDIEELKLKELSKSIALLESDVLPRLKKVKNWQVGSRAVTIPFAAFSFSLFVSSAIPTSLRVSTGVRNDSSVDARVMTAGAGVDGYIRTIRGDIHFDGEWIADRRAPMTGLAVGLAASAASGLSLQYELQTLASGNRRAADFQYAGIPAGTDAQDHISGLRFWLEGEQRDQFSLQYVVRLSNGVAVSQSDGTWAGNEPGLSVVALELSLRHR